jgi:hypothetical protein
MPLLLLLLSPPLSSRCCNITAAAAGAAALKLQTIMALTSLQAGKKVAMVVQVSLCHMACHLACHMACGMACRVEVFWMMCMLLV